MHRKATIKSVSATLGLYLTVDSSRPTDLVSEQKSIPVSDESTHGAAEGGERRHVAVREGRLPKGVPDTGRGAGRGAG